MDATMLLTADHDRVRGLFSRFEAAHEDGDNGSMGKLVEKVVTELQVHTKIEEEIFYPEVRQGGEQLDEIVSRAIEEHHVVDVLLGELERMKVGGEDWVAKVQVLVENVEHHATEEEQQMFPLVRRAFDTEALAALADRLEARKADLGAPTLADKAELTVEQLRDLAKDQEIPGRSEMDGDRLRATVSPE